MTILVTGAPGFIGHAVTAELVSRHREVHNAVRSLNIEVHNLAGSLFFNHLFSAALALFDLVSLPWQYFGKSLSVFVWEIARSTAHADAPTSGTSRVLH